MRLLPAGDRAILVELDDAGQRRRLAEALSAHRPEGVVDVVPAAVTVLVRVAPGTSLQRLADRLRAMSLAGEDEVGGVAVGEALEVPVVYDGPDLDEVAGLLGTTVAEVVARHTGQVWTVEFGGFAPGFGYLVGDGGGLDVPRRDTPRTRVPAGSVGLAGPYSGVYPHDSSGGWQLLGTTTLDVWDADRDPPALLTPGRRVRFVEVPR